MAWFCKILSAGEGRFCKKMLMKKVQLFSLIVLMLSLTSCELIGDIFKAGVWAGVLMVVLVIALIVFVIGRLFR
jgi:uncharacterized membrane protein